MEPTKIVLICAEGGCSRAVHRALEDRFGDVAAIVEPPVPRSRIFRRRLRKLGFAKVMGQVLFMTLVFPCLRAAARRRIEAIKREHGLEDGAVEGDRVFRVESVNADETRELLKELDPRVVVVNGTRIVGAATLAAVDACFINLHCGITPLYRGVHGGYWALAEDRPDLVGTTIHYIDTGIDTGGIIKQVFFTVTPRDNSATYPYLHVGAAIPELLEVVADIVENDRKPEIVPASLPSKLRTHPTIVDYLVNRLRMGVK